MDVNVVTHCPGKIGLRSHVEADMLGTGVYNVDCQSNDNQIGQTVNSDRKGNAGAVTVNGATVVRSAASQSAQGVTHVLFADT